MTYFMNIYQEYISRRAIFDNIKSNNTDDRKLSWFIEQSVLIYVYSCIANVFNRWYI